MHSLYLFSFFVLFLYFVSSVRARSISIDVQLDVDPFTPGPGPELETDSDNSDYMLDSASHGDWEIDDAAPSDNTRVGHATVLSSLAWNPQFHSSVRLYTSSIQFAGNNYAFDFIPRPDTPNPTSPQFSYSDSQRYAAYSYAAYEQNILSWTCGLLCSRAAGFTPLSQFTHRAFDSRGYVGFNDAAGEIIVAFRGTNPKREGNIWGRYGKWTQSLPSNIWHDLTAVPRPLWIRGLRDALVHSGFWGVYDSLRKPMWQSVSLALKLKPNYKIRVVGHSLGGAIASYAALDLARASGHATELHTFGSPRPGNGRFARYVSQWVGQALRMVRQNDPVPTMPPSAIGYSHVGQLIWHWDSPVRLGSPAGPALFIMCGQGDDDQTCPSSVFGRLHLNISDHSEYMLLRMKNQNPSAVIDPPQYKFESASLRQLQLKYGNKPKSTP